MQFRADGQTRRGISLVRVGQGQFEVLEPALTLPPLPLPNDLLPRSEGRGWRVW
jgi:hypothetical protein